MPGSRSTPQRSRPRGVTCARWRGTLREIGVGLQGEACASRRQEDALRAPGVSRTAPTSGGAPDPLRSRERPGKGASDAVARTYVRDLGGPPLRPFSSRTRAPEPLGRGGRCSRDGQLSLVARVSTARLGSEPASSLSAGVGRHLTPHRSWYHRGMHATPETGTYLRTRTAWLSQIGSSKRLSKAHTGFEPVPPP